MPPCLTLLELHIPHACKHSMKIRAFSAESSKIVLTQPIACVKRSPILYGRFHVAIRASFYLLTTDKSSKHLLKLEI